MTMPPGPAGHPYGATPAGPIVVRYNVVMGVAFVVLGALLFVLNLVSDLTFGLITGIVFVLLGVLYSLGTCVVVEPGRVKVKSPIGMTVKDEPIRGLGDLHFEGNKLYRSGDRKKLVNLGMGSVRSGDLAALRAAVDGARQAPPMAPPTGPTGPPPSTPPPGF